MKVREYSTSQTKKRKKSIAEEAKAPLPLVNLISLTLLLSNELRRDKRQARRIKCSRAQKKRIVTSSRSRLILSASRLAFIV